MTAVPTDRALLEVWTAGDDVVSALLEDPGEASLAVRDAALARLLVAWRGPSLDALVDCPACGEALEVGVALEPFAVDVPEEIAVGDVVVRLPTASDVAAAGDPLALARACVVRGDLNPVDVPAVAAAMEAAHPLATAALALTCPGCEHAWEAPVTLAPFAAAEVAAAGRRALEDVHVLAGAYGWTEDEVLAIPPARRRRYVELVGG